MLKLLRALLPARPGDGVAPPHEPPRPPPASVEAEGVAAFDVAAHLIDANGLPVLDWAAVEAWLAGVDDEPARARAWAACELAWLAHLGAALGPPYRLRQQGEVLLLSSLDDRLAAATLAFVDKTQQRVLRVLDGIAEQPSAGHDILLVFDDDETYYRYLAHYYGEDGEFAGSGGVYVNAGCGHFATVQAELRTVEPVIAHELTHACLAHLALPTWLDEGLAVNTEQRLCPPPADPFGHRPSPQRMHARHRQFWGRQDIGQFWSGQSFLRADEGNELSYDLARILVAQLAVDWPRFQAFVRAADRADGGEAAARQHLGVSLDDLVAALLERPPATSP
jgi:hypothetical protein